MNNDITVGALAFKSQYSDKTGSKRIEVSRGVNLPTTLTINHQVTTNSSTKKLERRSVVRFDRTQVLDTTTGETGVVSAYIVVVVPQGATVASSDIIGAGAPVQSLIDLLQEDDSGLDLMDEIFVNQEQ